MIQTALDHVEKLQSTIDNINTIEPLLYSNLQLAEQLKTVMASLNEAHERLKKPNLRIGLIGTTSAGKSTLVNALIGRQVAPMDSDEMSAGILHFVHEERSRLVVNRAENACWDEMDQYDLDDSEIYEHLGERVFKPYHAESKKRTVPIPQIRVEGPLLPMKWPDLFSLPRNGGIEIFDLPGLNSVNDSKNLSIIQEQLKACFSLVLLDYSHTDHKSRETLLNEIKHVVDTLGGTTDSILFAVNRVDRRNAHDEPLNQRLERLAEEIQQKLDIPSLPDLLPVTALPLFYGQVAWGTTAPIEGNQPTTTAKKQLGYFENFQSDCSKVIPKANTDFNYKLWFSERDGGTNLPEEDLRCWVRWTWEWSNGEKLLQKLGERIEERFAEVILAPILMRPVAEVGRLQAMLKEYCDTQRLESTNVLMEKKTMLNNTFNDVKEKVKIKGNDFLDKMVTMSERLSGDFDSVSQAVTDLGYKTGNSNLRKIIRETRKSLLREILQSIQRYYEEELLQEQLDELLSCLPVETKKQLCRSAEKYRASGMSGKNVKKGIHLQCKAVDDDSIKEMKGVEGLALCLYRSMKEALSVRASYLIQAKGPEIERMLASMLEEEMVALKKMFNDKIPDLSDTLTAILMEKHANMVDVRLPAEVFVWNDEPKTGQYKKPEKVGTKTVSYETGSCFKESKSRSEDVVKEIEYKTLDLPGIQEMTEQWTLGINKAESELWKFFGEWIQKSIIQQTELTLDAVDETCLFLISLLDERLKQSEGEHEKRLGKIDMLLTNVQSLGDTNGDLRCLQTRH